MQRPKDYTKLTNWISLVAVVVVVVVYVLRSSETKSKLVASKLGGQTHILCKFVFIKERISKYFAWIHSMLCIFMHTLFNATRATVYIHNNTLTQFTIENWTSADNGNGFKVLVKRKEISKLLYKIFIFSFRFRVWRRRKNSPGI